MTIHARVHNRTITLPPNIAVAEGAEVSVTLPDATVANPPTAETLPWLRRARGSATSGLTTERILTMTRGED